MWPGLADNDESSSPTRPIGRMREGRGGMRRVVQGRRWRARAARDGGIKHDDSGGEV